MSMVMANIKEETAGVKSLLNVKLKMHRKNFAYFAAIAALMYVSNLATTVFGAWNGIGIHNHELTDYSVPYFFGLIIAAFVIMLMYRQTNDKLSAFPQSNTGRFIASQIINYALVAMAGLMSLAMYLINCASMQLLSAGKGNVHLALNVGVDFIAAGFFTFIAYSFLVLALIDLAGAILRKWAHYAVMAFTALFVLAFINVPMAQSFTFVPAVVEYAPKALAFLIREPSFAVFMAKAAALWLVLVAAALAINYKTQYYKSYNSSLKKTVAIICAVILSVILIATPMLLMFTSGGSGGGNAMATYEMYGEGGFEGEAFPAESEIRIDVSHLPKGSSLALVGDNINIIDAPGRGIDGGEFVIFEINYSSGTAYANVSGTEALDDIRGEAVFVSYSPPEYTINGVDMMRFANPRIDAYLEEGALRINYSVDDAQVVFMPIWGIARQFDAFKDKGYYKEHLLGYSGGGNITPKIHIRAE